MKRQIIVIELKLRSLFCYINIGHAVTKPDKVNI